MVGVAQESAADFGYPDCKNCLGGNVLGGVALLGTRAGPPARILQ